MFQCSILKLLGSHCFLYCLYTCTCTSFYHIIMANGIASIDFRLLIKVLYSTFLVWGEKIAPGGYWVWRMCSIQRTRGSSEIPTMQDLTCIMMSCRSLCWCIPGNIHINSDSPDYRNCNSWMLLQPDENDEDKTSQLFGWL